MLNGVNLLSHSLILPNTRQEKRMLLLMLCLDIMTQLDAKILGLESIKELYATDSYFAEPFSKCSDGKGWEKYHKHDGFLFRANKLCIPDCSVQILLLQEAHAGGLMGHFGVKKAEHVLADHFFWLKMRRDVVRHVLRCENCHKAKSRLNPHGLC
jgi:hypothetical protein